MHNKTEAHYKNVRKKDKQQFKVGYLPNLFSDVPNIIKQVYMGRCKNKMYLV